MTHVFIVNEQTFKIHLEYMFAGTGGKNDAIFLLDHKTETQMHWKTEASIVDMISDISRVKDGDKILFYVQASNGELGKFYGVFKAVGTPFYDSSKDNYLYDQLGKCLNFRIKIKAFEVYPQGISEYEALDGLSGINHPSEMCWSLIYRKLKANRGCTMVTDAESVRLCSLIKNKNNNKSLNGTNFTYDSDNKVIIKSKLKNEYRGNELSLDIKNRLLVKAHKRPAFEPHLQAYIIQNARKSPLCEIIGIPEKDVWIGNEVSCGVGMQRIDVLTINVNKETVYIKVIELKCVEPYESIVDYQLPRYIDWIKDYIVPTYKDKKVIITPIVLAKKFTKEENLENFKKYCNDNFKTTVTDKLHIEQINYISFDINEKDISFEKTF